MYEYLGNASAAAAPAPQRPVVRCPIHTQRVFDTSTMPLIVRWAEDIILREKADAIVACGHSGLLVAGALAYVTRIPVFAVRKEGETAVATRDKVSGIAQNGRAKRWVWVDDFLSSGGTFMRSRRFAYNAGLIETIHPVAVLSYGKFENAREIIATEDAAWTAHDDYDVERYRGRTDAGVYKQYGFLTY